MEPLPYEIVEAMIQCFGRCFHYKDSLTGFLLSAGVARDLANKYRDLAKFAWTRRLLADLAETDEGRVLQRRIATKLYDLRDVTDKDVPDRAAALDALRAFKALALSHQLVVKEQQKQTTVVREQADAKAAVVKERGAKLDRLRQKFVDTFADENRQRAGYTLEDVLVELFGLFELEYRPSYKLETQQIDGHFRFEGFDYLVEARWRKDFPNEGDIAGFKQKVDTKLDATRGMFVSVQGFRPEVVAQFAGRGAKLIFVDGMDLMHVLEGRMDLRDALQLKIAKAAQEGVVYHPLVKRG